MLMLPEERLKATLSSLSGAMLSGAALVSASPVVPLRLLRCLVGVGPALFRAVVAAGTAPGEGVAVLAPEPGTSAGMIEEVRRALKALGAVEVVTEDALDAVAALAVGGPAFMCAAVEGLEEGAVREGLPRDTARSFAHQTALATALLLCEHSGSPADLKDQVASPGGTTIAALASLEDAAVRGIFIRAVQRSALNLGTARRSQAPRD
jgi:pyrroline-5-carboxylate reductase